MHLRSCSLAAENYRMNVRALVPAPRIPVLWATFATLLTAILIGCGGGGGSASSSIQTPGSTNSSGVTGTSTSSTSGNVPGTAGGSSAGSTSLTSGVGYLAPDTIYFADNTNSNETLCAISPSGSTLSVLGTLPNGFGAAIVNPSSRNSFVFTYSPNGTRIGIYTNQTLSARGATELVSPQFDGVSMLQVTPDGSTVVFIADANGLSSLYTVSTAGGLPRSLTAADTASLSPDGQTIVFSAPTNSGEFLGTISIAGGATTIMTNGQSVDLYPQFKKDGTQIVFSSNRSDPAGSAPFDLYTMTLSNKVVTRITTSTTRSTFGASFSGDGTRLSYVALDPSQPGGSGVFVMATNGGPSTQIWSSDSVGASTYWSSSSGRSGSSVGATYQGLTSLHLKKSH